MSPGHPSECTVDLLLESHHCEEVLGDNVLTDRSMAGDQPFIMENMETSFIPQDAGNVLVKLTVSRRGGVSLRINSRSL